MFEIFWYGLFGFVKVKENILLQNSPLQDKLTGSEKLI